MNLKDYIGKRGENIFTVLITKWCDGKPLFSDNFLGEKHEGTDFVVELVNPTSGHAQFYVSVRATAAKYTGKGQKRKVSVEVTPLEVQKLKQIHAPTYVVGIDIENVRGFIIAITQSSTGGIYGIPTRFSLNCRTLKALWKEADDYWTAKSMLAVSSKFSH
jgi:hypothetical protein